MPLLAKQPVSDVYWSDDFSTKKGWQNFGCDGMEYTGGVLRVTLDENTSRCYVSPPASVFLKQGTFSVQARRVTSNYTWYGLFFNTSSNLEKKRWALEARPLGGDPCDSDEGLIWLSYITDGLGTGDLWQNCTDHLGVDKNDWNTLKVIRNGDNVKAYINDSLRLSKDNSANTEYGYFDLEVASYEDTPVVVDFDNFILRTSVTP
jgi:hypothetical protein